MEWYTAEQAKNARQVYMNNIIEHILNDIKEAAEKGAPLITIQDDMLKQEHKDKLKELGYQVKEVRHPMSSAVMVMISWIDLNELMPKSNLVTPVSVPNVGLIK